MGEGRGAGPWSVYPVIEWSVGGVAPRYHSLQDTYHDDNDDNHFDDDDKDEEED